MNDPDDERALEARTVGAPSDARVEADDEDGARSETDGSSTEPSATAVSADDDADGVDDDADGVDGGDADGADSRAVLSRRLAAAAFGIYLVAAFALLLFNYGEGAWFGGDDWGLLDGRNLWSPGDLLRAQNGHWVTAPVIVYQVLYRLFGLHSYVPYQILTIVLHLTLCVLLRWVMRRAGVGPWVATITAGTFVLFGAGWENLILALQITLVGSLVFGIAQLLLADHDGPAGWRDAAAIGAGLVALMCSSVGVVMVAIVGISTLMRRGWRMALLQTAPLGAMFIAWYVWQRGQGQFDGDGGVVGLEAGSDGVTPGALIAWLRSSFSATFTSLGGSGLVAIALVAMLVVGIALAIRHRGWLDSRRTLAVPISLGIGSVVLMVFIGTQRAALSEFYPNIAASSRYQAMVAALVLPALGVAAAELIRRQRFLAPVALGLLLVGVPSSLATFGSNDVVFYKGLTQNSKSFILFVADSPLAGEISQEAHPDPNELTSANLTVDFLRFARKQGKLPEAGPNNLFSANIVNTRLRVTQGLLEERPPPNTCREEPAAFEVEARAGERFVMGPALQIAIENPSGGWYPAVGYNTTFAGSVLTSEFDQTFTVSPATGEDKVIWCTVD